MFNIYTDAKLDEITDKGLVITVNGETQTIAADTILTAFPLSSDMKLAESLKGIAPEIYAIGDCHAPAYIANAVAEGSRIARAI